MQYLIAFTLDQPLVMGLQSVTLQVNGYLILLFFIAVGAYIGWARGIRALLTMALMSVFAYILCVQSGQLFISIINRLYQNGPRLLAFLLNRDINSAFVPDPLIEPGFTIPLFFRFVFFLLLIAFGWFFRQKAIWYQSQPDDNKEPYARTLGAVLGGFIATLWTAAMVSFWVELVNAGQAFGGFLATVFYALPDITPYMTALITIFFILLGVIILFNLPKLAK
jgi:hypothetical protein